MEYCTTIGIDVSDRSSKVCVMAKEGGARRILLETTCETTREGFSRSLGRLDRGWPVVFETGTHCRWMKRHIEGMGFATIVANPAEVKLISESNSKNDRGDAAKLARIALADPGLLKPVRLRGDAHQSMIQLHEARRLLMKCRNSMICQLRCFAKTMGFRLPDCAADWFHEMDRSGWPAEYEQVAWPMMDAIESLNMKMAAYESAIRVLAGKPEFSAQVDRVREVYGIGVVGATMLVAAIDGDPGRFRRARDIGPYLGLVPRTSQSGMSDPQLRMTKAGNELVRGVLVECANVVMKKGSRDTDLKLKGLRIASRGGRIAKAKAKASVARGLAVLAVALLKDPGRKYVPLSEAGRLGLERCRAEEELLPNTGKSRRMAD